MVSRTLVLLSTRRPNLTLENIQKNSGALLFELEITNQTWVSERNPSGRDDAKASITHFSRNMTRFVIPRQCGKQWRSTHCMTCTQKLNRNRSRIPNEMSASTTATKSEILKILPQKVFRTTKSWHFSQKFNILTFLYVSYREIWEVRPRPLLASEFIFLPVRIDKRLVWPYSCLLRMPLNLRNMLDTHIMSW